MTSHRLDERVAVVTGASSGIGEHCARVLDGVGATVVLVARRRDRLERLARQLARSVVIVADLSDPATPEAVIGEVEAELGRLDVLVNAAGVVNAAPASRETLPDIHHVLNINLVAPFAMAQAALPLMRANGGGSIVNVTSVIAAVSESTIPEASYAASKGGLASLTRELAAQWARYNVRVNALAPGWFPTAMTETLTENPERFERLLSRIPLGRVGALEELDGALLLLACTAGSYITGQTITVDGGASAL